jgi:glycosyltransferase involved in cell wall biosynthesis
MVKKYLISIIVTVYNEESIISEFLDALSNVIVQLKQFNVEVLFINDGSTDNTVSILKKQLNSSQSFRFRVVSFSRNFGKENAMKAGLDYANGDAAIMIDADLEDPVELIPLMIEQWVAGYDIVYTVRTLRVEALGKRFFAYSFYKVINLFSDIHIYHNAGDYRLFDRKAITALNRFGERNRFSKGLFNWIGFKSTSIEYVRHARKKGHTKWSFSKLWHYAVDGIVSFSTIPLKLWVFIGTIISIISFLYAIFLTVRTLVYGIELPGYASTIVIMMFLNGIILVNLGILSEYIARIFIEVKQRPSYLIADILDSNSDESNK